MPHHTPFSICRQTPNRTTLKGIWWDIWGNFGGGFWLFVRMFSNLFCKIKIENIEKMRMLHTHAAHIAPNPL